MALSARPLSLPVLKYQKAGNCRAIDPCSVRRSQYQRLMNLGHFFFGGHSRRLVPYRTYINIYIYELPTRFIISMNIMEYPSYHISYMKIHTWKCNPLCVFHGWTPRGAHGIPCLRSGLRLDRETETSGPDALGVMQVASWRETLDDLYKSYKFYWFTHISIWYKRYINIYADTVDRVQKCTLYVSCEMERLPYSYVHDIFWKLVYMQTHADTY